MDIWNSRRSAIVSNKAICSSSQPLATATGVKILQAGGNAADAAVAMAAVLNLTEPCSTGIGGDAFALYYDAKTKKVHCLSGNGASPSNLTLEYLHSVGIGLSEGQKKWDQRSGLCVTVPGAAALWEDLVVRHGKLPLSEVLAPAIDLGENGFPIGPVTATHWAEAFLQGEEALHIYRPNGQNVQEGQLFRNPDLANTFRSLATHGAKAGFYSGRIAEAIVEGIKEMGGVMTLEDLTNHSTSFDDAISTVYRGVRIYQTPPPSHGLAVLLALNMIQEYEGTADSPYQPAENSFPGYKANWERRADFDEAHITIECMRRAFADALEYIGDPHRETNIPLAKLLSREYAQTRIKEINPNHATSAKAVDLSHFLASETVYFSTVDAEGNACSFINSNYMAFGTGYVPRGTGFTLQNRGYNFSLVPGHLNQVGPNKRPYHTIIPSLATYEADGSLFGVFGNMVSHTIILSLLCVLFNYLTFSHGREDSCSPWVMCNLSVT
jgi:gamma-glutamyltranspeptidase/glutathione hydrolase